MATKKGMKENGGMSFLTSGYRGIPETAHTVEELVKSGVTAISADALVQAYGSNAPQEFQRLLAIRRSQNTHLPTRK